MVTLLDLFSENDQIKKWHQNLTDKKRQLILGLSTSTKALAIASSLEKEDRIVLLTSTYGEAEGLVSDLISILGEELVYPFLVDDAPMVEFLMSSQEKIISRVEALRFLTDSSKKGILVCNIAASRLILPSPNAFKDSIVKISVGEEYDQHAFIHQLKENGYRKVTQVQTQGEFSLRGDILDIFEISQLEPCRIEFFGDEIDGIRSFEVETQLSKENKTELTIFPASDMLLREKDYQRGQSALEKQISKTLSPILKSYLEEILSSFHQKQSHADSRKFLSLCYDKTWTVFDYIEKDTPIFFDDYQKLMNQYEVFERDLAQYFTEELQNSKAFSDMQYFSDIEQIYKKQSPVTFFSNLQKGLGNLKFDKIYQFNQYPMQEFFNQFSFLKEEIERYKKMDYTIILQSSNSMGSKTLEDMLEEYQIKLDSRDKTNICKESVNLIEGNLRHGFHFVDEKILLITEHEIFQKKLKRRFRRQHVSNAERLKDYNELEKGDYVVHHIHGIGQYLGIETIEIKGIHRDYVSVQYQNGDQISIPVEQIHLLSKYISSDGKAPKLNKLNDGHFKKAKQKVKNQVEDIADDLIKLYSERSQLKGFAFSADDDDQDAFDDAFPYVETDDQLRSIEEIKRDMQASQPMDRLLVGDVGFGKTEVAMRAAFKAVNDHKQVVILVPTTVLAQQHYTNFKERFQNFAVNIDVLSRFRSKKEQTATLEKLKNGQVDILIGTHRVLSKDVVFADLGLMIIDEEQRFGVKHKETLKELKKQVDVLTLTATPIPRTLHMSMLGIRDLSVIETPPTNRYPVQTYVLEKNDSVIRDAVLREMERGGQVYYLYNKVDTIVQKVSELQELIPEASIGYVHGRMSEVQLENTLLDFIEGQYDILVTTTIIETGVDIPNANTLFIENADHMGLSTLYQLRGRVGRSNRIAYAYLMYRPEKSISEVSEKRLEAIKGFTELGSGFKIAMRDLSIRGAGNLLGKSQSGFIDSVGFELYSQLLEEAIAKRNGNANANTRTKGNAELILQIDAYLPDTYISDQRHKIEIYKKIRQIDNRVNYEELQEELIDRFGEYPDVVAYLLEIGLVKSYLDKVFVQRVERKDNKITIQFEKVTQRLFLAQDYFKALSVTNLKAGIAENKGLMELVFDVQNKKDYEILEGLLIFGESLLEIKESKEENSI
ncbi:TPA: transcription-repair coupling factor [Streptococcus pneumoniae]|jgi:transcription-repair coupling factor|uniref:Transcription-repair-coupling factor n=1 Tax=Streptococcus pneumoniae serotype 4 (strain ATCC BAA-334 / TIGR4) TaxID=170187 RepID=A0A0H2UMR6_STRPN|nr:transcription-repair coupling factor [Streptococcus pneumoniae]EHD81141.1 transcription-repair coupling factor [Streptococcus pneumoniae GA07643]AAK74199.1 transcription-repair coupling factor [Streptococcus pneumoniae TIGR4]AUF83939.1 transcription-repair coupling factor [Streptococcus pneumoniae]EHE28073.1 transcription-repair coupling factor [Streptococcus pneumoniae GA47360]EHZ28184.1 transcription-repair coupling factor [Streptococcus pneumoniae GA18068]